MWQKTLVIILLFFIFAILQNSFFIHFSFFGSYLNLIFILFFTLIFSHNSQKSSFLGIFLLSIFAGFILDIYSHTYIGPSIILLIIIGLFVKKIQSMLKNREDDCPFEYFLPLFVISFLFYTILIDVYLQFTGINKIILNLNWITLISLVYNSVVASIFFCLYKKWQKSIK